MAHESEPPFDIVRAESAAHFEAARALFREYAATLETGICLVGFERELAVLPEMYGEPDGTLLLAIFRQNGSAFGCAGVRRLDPTRAELKRVYVQPQARKLGAGRFLTEGAIQRAKALGYEHLVLDTLDTMTDAQSLYRKLGFVERGAFTKNTASNAPVAGLRYFLRSL